MDFCELEPGLGGVDAGFGHDDLVGACRGFEQLEAGFGCLELCGEGGYQRALIVGVLLRDRPGVAELADPLPGQLGPFQLALFGLVEGLGFGTLLGAGAVEEAFELGFGQVELGLGQGDFVLVLGGIEAGEDGALLDGLTLLHDEVVHPACQAETELDLGRGAFDSAGGEDGLGAGRLRGPVYGDPALGVDHEAQ